jgi:hypothetical protein
MVEGVEGRLHCTAYIFPVLRAFAVCSAPIVGAGLVGRDDCPWSSSRWAAKCSGRASCLPYMNRWVLVWALGLSGDFDSGADGDEIVELDHVGIP